MDNDMSQEVLTEAKRRIVVENSRIEVKHTGGIGAFFYAAIPGAIAGALILWLTAVTGWIDLTQELRQERRAAERVGIVVMPSTPINVVIHESTCLKSGGAYLDYKTLTVYAVNKCSHSTPFPGGIVTREIAPDGTTINNNKDLLGDSGFRSGEKRETQINLRALDRRMVTLDIQLEDEP